MAISEPGDPPAPARGEPGSASGKVQSIVGGRHLLTINTGSSSLKAALYRLWEGATETPELRAEASRIGDRGGGMRLADERGETLEERRDHLPDHAAALDALMSRLRDRGLDRDDLLAAVGHRIVHGGDRHREPQRVAPGVVADLRALVPIDPNHLPQAIAAIEAVGRAYPAVPQVACFDTAFHSRMPRVARLYALPSRLAEEGIIRYGFHGLSYEYVMEELRRLEPEAYGGRVVVARPALAPEEPAEGPLSGEHLTGIQSYWQAANYLTVGQIYLQDNPLLREPLRPEHIKPRLLGHWGTSLGLSLIYVHLNRLIRERGAEVIYLAGSRRGPSRDLDAPCPAGGGIQSGQRNPPAVRREDREGQEAATTCDLNSRRWAPGAKRLGKGA